MSRRQWEKQFRKTTNKKARKDLKDYKKKLEEAKRKRHAEDMKKITATLQSQAETIWLMDMVESCRFINLSLPNTCSAPDCNGSCRWNYCPGHKDPCRVTNCSYRTNAEWRNGSNYCRLHGCTRSIDWDLGHGWLYCGNPKMPNDTYCLNCKTVITLYLCMKPVFGKDVTKIIIRTVANVRML